ncbi:hypothetical protein RIR_jg12394.t2 [Rhizophagus irregularis DAOM 181602=DAOM 197198]|nr:hypothetical protein RIR_jg12394.t1 [Rhizophagus irregularis DAOM 181602=DAOM 197198]GET62097.1 hypothetical protein RIR_jg12394.t2 [Rhizophagus irregularis DAOM 181602=DAOM 197198]
MDFRCFDFGKRTEIMKPKGTPDVWMMESNRTNTLWIPSDLGFRFRYFKDLKRQNGSVLQYSKSIKYETPDERNCRMNFYEPDLKVCAPIFRIKTLDEITNRTLFVERNAGTNSRTGLWVEGNKGKEKTKEKGNISKVQRLIGQTRIQYFEGSAVFVHMEFNISKGSTVLECSTVLERMEFNILKVQRSLNVWNLTFRRFTPASTLALDI